MGTEISLKDFNRWVAFLNVFRAIHPRIEAQMIHVFLAVAAYPDRSQQEIADMVGITQTSVSRNLAMLSKHHNIALDLVEIRENPENRRYKLVSLTPKGKALLAQLRGLS